MFAKSKIMFVKQLYTSCISEAAYYIESNGEAAIIDPLRDVEEYLRLAAERKAIIKYVFETHFHADFVSGHIDLSKKTGAPIIYGPTAVCDYDVVVAKDGDRFKIGVVELEVMHTPGHTLESSCYLLRDENGKTNCVFTGDTLFVGDVGRPDLLGTKISKEDLASYMFDSLNKKIKPLADDVIVYPAHGPGSSCGKNLGPQTFSTIGEQKKTNYALQEMSREAFIAAVTTGLSPPPQYFPINAMINKHGYSSLDAVVEKAMHKLSPADFKAAMSPDIIVLDTRKNMDFELGFVPSSVNIGLDGRFAEWVGTLLDINKSILLVADAGKEKESVVRMSRVGYDNVIGYLDGGFASWKNAGYPIDVLVSIDAKELALDYAHEKNLLVLDVRKQTEFEAMHVEGALNLPLADLEKTLTELDKNDHVYVHCLSGYRSVIASSLLRKNGFINVKNVLGGFSAIEKTKIPLVSEILNKNPEAVKMN